MATTNIMNIPSTTVNVNPCNETCSFSFDYPTSNTCQVQNINSQYFHLTYNNSINSVEFQNEKYNVSYIDIYFPSRHHFNNSTLMGEIVISHVSNTNKILNICIPFDNQINASESPLLNNILSEINDKQITSDNQQYQLSLQEDYNLNSFVKYEPYYFYVGNSNDSEFFIVYQPSNGFRIPNNLTNVKNLINSQVSPYPYIHDLYYNNNGPTSNSGDDIYIDCQPVDEDGNLLIDKYDNNNIEGYNNGMSIMILYGCIGAIIIIVLGYFLYLFNKTINNIFYPASNTGVNANGVNAAAVNAAAINAAAINPGGIPTTLPSSFTIATRTLLRALGVI